MKSRIRTLLFCCWLINEAFALDVFVNSRLYQQYQSLTPLLYPVQVAEGRLPGISLDELLPLMLDITSLKLTTGQGIFTLPGTDWAGQLSTCYLIPQQPGFSLLFPGRRFNGVTRIDLEGEELAGNTLEVWLSWEGVPRLKEEIRRFADLHRIVIKTVEVPRIDTKLLALLRGNGTPPDVVMLQADYLPDLTSARALQNLDYMLPAQLPEKGVDVFRLDGKIWAIPFYFDAQLCFYNTALIPEEIRPDWSLADLEQLARRLIKQGVIPLSWNAYSAYWLIPFQMGFGKQDIINPDGTITIDDPATRSALQYILHLQQEGWLKVLERDAMLTYFTAGKAAIILTGSYSIPEFESLGLPFKVAAYPFNPAAGRSLAPVLDFKGFAITRKTRHPVLARRLLQYLSGVGVQQRFSLALFKFPANTGVWPVMEQQHKYYPVLAESYRRGVVIPPWRAYPVFKNTMWKLLRFILSGEMTVAETLDLGQGIINQKLKE